MDRKRALKLRFRRMLHLQKRQAQELGQQAEQRLEDDFFKRLERLANVRRFVAAWVLLLVLLSGAVIMQTRALSGYFQTLQPVPGGTYAEGVLGAFTNANPLYATDLADTTVSHLVFSALLTYDEQNQLTGDLAESWAVDARGTTYTVHLRPHLTWQDGQPLTSEDVLFTYQTIQNPDARSPLFGSFQGVQVAAPDARTVTFTLPNVLASFPYSLTNGIVPKHILQHTPMVDMRGAPFNTADPVGSGPFAWRAIEVSGETANDRQEDIALKSFANYHFGKPKISNFVLRTFRDRDRLVASFNTQEINAIAGLSDMPAGLQNQNGAMVYNLPLTAEVMTFFDTQHGVTSDGIVRHALVSATNNVAIAATLGYPTQPVGEPLLHGQLAYNPAYKQEGYDPTAATRLLDGDGWAVGKAGVRYKAGQPLIISLVYQKDGEYARVATQLAQYWRAVGCNVQLLPQNDADFQAKLSQAPSSIYNNYDALLYGISVGVDPDVYIYWDSSQIDVRSPSRLNFSAYNSGTADAALEAGRTRLDPALRIIKYQPFLQAWQTDAPALALYQPRFLYITRGTVFGLNEHPINTDAQRFSNVWNWEIREVRR